MQVRAKEPAVGGIATAGVRREHLGQGRVHEGAGEHRGRLASSRSRRPRMIGSDIGNCSSHQVGSQRRQSLDPGDPFDPLESRACWAPPAGPVRRGPARSARRRRGWPAASSEAPRAETPSDARSQTRPRPCRRQPSARTSPPAPGRRRRASRSSAAPSTSRRCSPARVDRGARQRVKLRPATASRRAPGRLDDLQAPRLRLQRLARCRTARSRR